MLHPRGQVQSARRRLEDGFSNVVLIAAVQAFDMEIEPAFLNESFKKFLDQFSLKITDSGCFELHFIHEVRAAGEIDHNACQRLIKRDVRLCEAGNPAAVPTRFLKRFTQNPTDVLDGVVAIDFEVAFRAHFEIELSVAR